MKDEPPKIPATLKVVITGEFYDDEASEETLRYCVEQDLEDAGFDVDIELLKEQEARVMALDELTEIYVEFKGNNCPVRLTNFDLQKIVKHAVDGDCRLWTGKPTDEQRQAVKWE